MSEQPAPSLPINPTPLGRWEARPKALYFFYFAGVSAFVPFLSLYYSDLGLSRTEIGLLTGMVPLITMVSAPLWGAAADAGGRHRLALALAIGGTILAVLGLSRPQSVIGLLPFVFFYAVCTAPIAPLIDNAVIAWLGERRNRYGGQRVWGSIGWTLMTLAIGPFLRRDLSAIFVLFAVLMLAALVLGWGMPFAAQARRQSYLAAVRPLLHNSRFLFFSFIALVEGVCLAVFLNFLFLRVEELQGSRALMALSLTAATISEIPFWYLTAFLLRRWGPDRMLLASLVLLLIRAVGYAAMSAAWWILPINLLHGPAFALMYSAGVTLADESAPKGLGATAQGLFNAMVFGVGAALGSLLGGLTADAWGLTTLFAGTAALVATAMALFGWVRRAALWRPV